MLDVFSTYGPGWSIKLEIKKLRQGKQKKIYKIYLSSARKLASISLYLISELLCNLPTIKKGKNINSKNN